MANNYILALKEFNKNKPKWCVPKKGSADYQKVMKIKAKLDKQSGKGIKMMQGDGLLMDLGKQLMSRFGDMKELLKIGKYYGKSFLM